MGFININENFFVCFREEQAPPLPSYLFGFALTFLYFNLTDKPQFVRLLKIQKKNLIVRYRGFWRTPREKSLLIYDVPTSL